METPERQRMLCIQGHRLLGPRQYRRNNYQEGYCVKNTMVLNHIFREIPTLRKTFSSKVT